MSDLKLSKLFHWMIQAERSKFLKIIAISTRLTIDV